MTKLLKNLTMDELKQLLKSNTQFEQAVYEDAYDDNMFWQGEWWNEMLGKDNRGYKCDDHYTSFYFTLTDAEKFISAIPECCVHYLPAEHTHLYERAVNLLHKWQDMTYEEQDEDEEVYEEMEQAAVNLMRAIEDTLHTFEDIDESCMEMSLDKIADGMSHMSEWELLDDGKTIAEHITKLYR